MTKTEATQLRPPFYTLVKLLSCRWLRHGATPVASPRGATHRPPVEAQRVVIDDFTDVKGSRNRGQVRRQQAAARRQAQLPVQPPLPIATTNCFTNNDKSVQPARNLILPASQTQNPTESSAPPIARTNSVPSRPTRHLGRHQHDTRSVTSNSKPATMLKPSTTCNESTSSTQSSIQTLEPHSSTGI
jgi:hypothetical protein